ncbi:MAG: HPr family phosphocarrier protein [Albidovulum sp.]|nr:HPr family phosphocarrier protein [Albidovulum sp.]MDE0530452.1 HPr family phosphocarrier protein [Albidovulum sp.]
MKIHRSFRIVNEKGLHARAAAKFVEVAERFEANAEVSKDGSTAGADSIMGLLMLVAAKGTIIDVEAEGSDAEDLCDALSELIASKFYEEL